MLVKDDVMRRHRAPRTRLILAAAGALIALALPAASAHAAGPKNFVYTSGTLRLWGFGGDSAGALAAINNVKAGSGAAGIALSPDGHSLYVAGEAEDIVSQYDVAADGTVSPKAVATVPAGDAPFGVAVSPAGGSVYVANQASDSISQYAVAADGSLSPRTPATVPAGDRPIGIAVAPDGRSVYATNLLGRSISQFDVDGAGRLVAKSPAAVPVGRTVIGVTTSIDGDSVYVAAWGPTSAAAGYVAQFDASATGALSPKSPAEVGADVSPAMLAAHPGGHSLYVTNQTNRQIRQYDIAADGRLTPKAAPSVLSAGKAPFGIAVSPDGANVYVANNASADVSQFGVVAGGGLAPMTPARVTAGSKPVGIAVRLAEVPDETPPTIDLRSPADGSEYLLGSDLIADFDCADEGGSELATCVGDTPDGAALDTSEVGKHAFSVHATDNAGNAAAVTHHYLIIWPWEGWLGKVDSPPAVNLVHRAGQKVTFRFSLGAYRGLDVLGEHGARSREIACAGEDVAPGPLETALSHSDRGVRYDEETGQYRFRWVTDEAWAGACREFVLELRDGTTHRALFRFADRHGKPKGQG